MGGKVHVLMMPIRTLELERERVDLGTRISIPHFRLFVFKYRKGHAPQCGPQILSTFTFISVMVCDVHTVCFVVYVIISDKTRNL